MKEYAFVKTIKFSEEDLIDLIDAAIEGGIGYWCCIGNDTKEWDEVETEYPKACIDELMYHILEKGESIVLIDKESDETHHLTMDKFLKGIQMAIDCNVWDGDTYNADAIVGDCIFQYALFGKLIYG